MINDKSRENRTEERTRIKICGLRREEDIACVNRFLPEYIGFVFAPKSRRYVDPVQAAKLRQGLADGITPVGVFVNEDPRLVAQLLEAGTIEIAQLHGQEDESYLSFLRMLTDKPLIKAFRIDTKEDVQAAQSSSAWQVLVDHGAGGTGHSFEWSLLSGLGRPYFLAGGLSPENVGDAVHLLHPFAVDVSSGVEGADGKTPQELTAERTVWFADALIAELKKED